MDGPFGEKTAGKYIACALAQFSVVLLRQYGPGPLLADRLGHLEDDLLAPLLRLARTVPLVEGDAALLYFLISKVYVHYANISLSLSLVTCSPSSSSSVAWQNCFSCSTSLQTTLGTEVLTLEQFCLGSAKESGTRCLVGRTMGTCKRVWRKSKKPDVIKCWALFFRSRRVCKGWARVP